MKRLLYILLVVACGLMAASCSTKKNTASTRRWQSFVTRYNVYFNGEQAYIEGRAAQDKGLTENYTELLPVFGVGYEKQRGLGKSNFETAVTKCEKAIQLHSIKKKPVVDGSKSKTAKQKAYLSRKEFNPFLKHAWLLMGKSQFQKGDFAEAAATFSYITRFYAPEPDVVAEARIWLARCYTELEWFFDAEDVLQRLDRDSMPNALNAERDLTLADYYIRQEKLDDAIPCLKRAVKKEHGKNRKARLYYLLGQCYMAVDRKADAYKALSKCISQSPPYEMSFHARILQTEAITTASNAKSMVKRLRRMARRDNNKEYLDQVYYAIGNIYMQQRDTVAAIAAYEQGRASAERPTLETAVLLLRLGGIYWDQRRFDKAQPCYTTAIGLMDKDHDDYRELTRRSKVLDALVPPTSAIYLQDSLQWLASLDEPSRLAAIDRVIDALKKKEAEERKAQRDSLADARQRENGGDGPREPMRDVPGAMGANMGGGQEWYFYNPQAVMQGKQAFTKEWGNRRNEDDWRRSNRTVLANNDMQDYDYAAADSIEAAQQAVRDSLLATGMSERDVKRWLRDHADGAEEEEEEGKKKELSPEEDPHCREYYLAQIPFTLEQRAASDSIIRESLFEAAVIEKDKLEDLALAAETFARLERQFPTFDRMNEATYHQFLLYGRWAEWANRDGQSDLAATREAKAENYRNRLRQSYPDYEMTRVVCDPEFERNSRYGRQIEDSLYTLTYEAYRRGDRARVEAYCQMSGEKFPKGANRPKFLFVRALANLGYAPVDTVAAQLRTVASEYPKSDVAEMAGMIVKGLEAGRTIGSANFDLGSLWARRTANTESANAGQKEERALSPDREVPFVFLIAYETGDVERDDRLLYDLAHFNFTTYVYRGFDIDKVRDKNMTQFRISGFRDYDDVHNYAQRVFREAGLAAQLRTVRIELISERNLEMLGTTYSFEDYRAFYDKHFAPLDINPDLPLEFEPEDEGIEYEDATPDEEIIYRPDLQSVTPEGTPATGDTPEHEERTVPVGGIDDNGDPLFEDDPLRPVFRDDDFVADDDAPSAKKTDDGFVADDDDAPAAKKTDDGFVADDDDEFKPVQKTEDPEVYDE